MAEQKHMRPSSERTPKLKLVAEQPSIGECWTPPKKDTPCPRAKEKPPARWQEGQKSHLGSNPIPTRDARKAQTKPCAHQDPGTPQETEPELPPAEAQVSSGLPQGPGLWLPKTWEVQHVSPTIEPPKRQPTNWRTSIPKKFLHCCKSSGAHNIFANLGIRQRD